MPDSPTGPTSDPTSNAGTDDLTARLDALAASLDAGDVAGTSAGAEAARRLGAQRTRRTRAGLALAACVAVGTGVGVAAFGGAGSPVDSPQPAATATVTTSPQPTADLRIVIEASDLPGHPDLHWQSTSQPDEQPVNQWCLDMLEPAPSLNAERAVRTFGNEENGEISERVWGFADSAAATAAFDDIRAGLESVTDGCAKLFVQGVDGTGIGDEFLLGEYVVADPDPEQDRVVTIQAARTGLVVTMITQQGLAYDYGLGELDSTLLETAVQRQCKASSLACAADATPAQPTP